jgi:hypothetical protein
MAFANLKILSRFNLHDTVVNNVFNPENISGVRLSGGVKKIRDRDLPRCKYNGM